MTRSSTVAWLRYVNTGNWLLHFIRTRPCSFPASTTTNMSADPLFTFGVIADIQYADLDDGFNFTRTRKRYYRNSLQLLRNARDHWSEAPVQPEFVLQLGDIIDGFNTQQHASRSALDTVLREFGSSPVEVHHVWGNHEFYNFTRGELLCSELNSTLHVQRRLGESRPGGDIYAYSFSPYPGFCFIVLDAYDMSLLGLDQDSEQYQRALKLIQKYNGNQDLNQPPTTTMSHRLLQRFTKFNGGFSQEQLDWLDSVLSCADDKQEKVTIVSHLPVHPDSTDPVCLAWNHSILLQLIQKHPSVVLFMAGHDHDGGYHYDWQNHVHHLTLEGVIETPPDSNAFGTVSVYQDRMVLTGHGRTASRVFDFS
ncbi:manganese-dependent ADP-ribose/CDP-alcohol diphosphatase [Periophthalmus magnuspinnatus]|uniref:manganese-dependent ADP-ribose/CDP-alcohol diphosphatase n=1 Tax=Periophthalmus magnuspinnatus TaxID=409849 RepID=UPI00145A4FFF|nr:manganese-dependent ADP-ribose/CDP-alcohol diphosphatase [Periophthalmus magnuspinnatus]